jgi:hypothetical protein
VSTSTGLSTMRSTCGTRVAHTCSTMQLSRDGRVNTDRHKQQLQCYGGDCTVQLGIQ